MSPRALSSYPYLTGTRDLGAGLLCLYCLRVFHNLPAVQVQCPSPFFHNTGAAPADSRCSLLSDDSGTHPQGRARAVCACNVYGFSTTSATYECNARRPFHKGPIRRIADILAIPPDTCPDRGTGRRNGPFFHIWVNTVTGAAGGNSKAKTGRSDDRAAGHIPLHRSGGTLFRPSGPSVRPVAGQPIPGGGSITSASQPASALRYFFGAIRSKFFS